MKVLILTAIYPTPDNPAFGSFVRTQAQSLKRAGVDVEVLALSRRIRKLIYPLGFFQLRKRLAQTPVDLVHAHYSYCGFLALTQRKAPVVVTFHGDDLLGTVTPSGKTSWLSRKIAAAGSVLGRLVDAAIVQTPEMAAKIPHGNVHVIPHEVDFDLFRPTPRDEARKLLGLSPEKKYLLFAADPRIPVKHFPLAQAVGERLTQQDGSVELLVVYKETQDRLALYMSACDVLVFPSYQEGSPNIVKQAMACNLPIVATDVGDVREVTGGTRGCFICNPRVDEFAAKICEVLRWRGRTEGRKQIEHFAVSCVSGKIIAVYEQVLNRQGASGRERASERVVATQK